MVLFLQCQEKLHPVSFVMTKLGRWVAISNRGEKLIKIKEDKLLANYPKYSLIVSNNKVVYYVKKKNDLANSFMV